MPDLVGPLEFRFPNLDTPRPEVRAPHAVRRFLEATATAAAQTVDTFGWDTVFAITFADVNKQLAKPGTTPAAFDITEPSGTGSTAAIGTYDPWRCTGGSGEELIMTVPIRTGNLNYQNSDYMLDGVRLEVKLKLRFLEQADGKLTKLVTAADEPAKVIGVTNPNSTDPILRAAIGIIMQKWFEKNLATFTTAFAAVTLNEKADKDQLQWLKPTAAGYAFQANTTTPDDGVFAVLCMTEGRKAPPTWEVSPVAIPAGARSGFLISGSLTLEKMVRPAVPGLFAGSPDESYFGVFNNGKQIRNTKPLQMADIKQGAATYKPAVDVGGFELTLEADALSYTVKAQFEFSAGITVKITCTGRSRLVLVKRADGTSVFGYEKIGEPKTEHTIEVATGIVVTEVVLALIMAAVGAGIGYLIEKLGATLMIRIVVAVSIAVVGLLVSLIPQYVKAAAEGQLSNALPSVDLAVLNATKAVAWPGATGYELTSAALNGALQIGGDPKFVD